MSSKAGKSGLVPKLRFPKFCETGGWEIRPLGMVCEILNNRRKPITSSNRVSGAYPYYGASGIVDYVSDFIFDERLLLIGEDGAKWGAYESTAFIVEGKYWVNNHAHVLKPFGVKDTLLENYLNMLDLDPFVTGAAPPKLTLGKLKEIPVPVPSLADEQQKIADCLASLDELITLEAQKLDTLKTHKKGLMQQLFPAEGETLPKLRFPEFLDAGEWEEKSIGDLGDVVTGSTPSTVRTEFYGGGIPFVSPADISDLPFVSETKTTLTDLGFSETRPIKANSVLFVCIGSTIGKVAQNVLNCATNQQINSVIPNAKHSGEFVYYILSLNAGCIANLAGKQAVPIINKTQFSSVRLLVPRFTEQERVAACLASLDDLITTQTQKLAALKIHKKGLMQQLFPALDAEVWP